ncbi:MAG: hypothetical protein ACLUTA_17285 [Blautia wexlerae]
MENLSEAYYFSTSAGITSTDEIWGARKPAAYLKSVVCDFDRDSPEKLEHSTSLAETAGTGQDTV